MRRIEAGQTLTTRSACDHDCIYTVRVLERKGQYVRVEVDGEEKRVKVHSWYDGSCECIYAYGKYSMCPIFKAPEPQVN